MSRLLLILMLAGSIAALGCEREPADRLPGKVTSEDVRRDFDKAAQTAADYAQQTKEAFQKKPKDQPANRTPEKATSGDVRRDARQANKTTTEHSQQTADEFRKKAEPRPADRTPEKVAPEDVRHDAGVAKKTTAKRSQPTTDEFQENDEPQPADGTPEKVAPEDVRHDASEAVSAVSKYYRWTKKDFQKKLENQLDEMDDKLTELREKGRNLKGDAKVTWDENMAELDIKRDTARAKLNKVVHSSVEAWKDVQKGAQSAYDDLDTAFRAAWQEF
jgi:regulator of replication initiation timing